MTMTLRGVDKLGFLRFILVFQLSMRRSASSYVSQFLKARHSIQTKRLRSVRQLSDGDDTAAMMVPRAAVSTVVQCCLDQRPYYLLVKRGEQPSKGLWSLPGGKLEWGESTLTGAKRELSEETQWPIDLWNQLQWYSQTICATESIGEGYHYLIAQCYAQLPSRNDLPVLKPADDAAACDWFTEEDMQQMLPITPGVLQVIQRVKDLSTRDLLLSPEVKKWRE